MKKSFVLLIILVTFLLSFISFFLILNYLDPYSFPILAVSFLVFTFFAWLSSFFTLLIYFFKKVYNRWDVYIYHVKSSFRQAVFLTLFIIGSVIFYIFKAPLLVSITLLWILFIFLELFINSLES